VQSLEAALIVLSQSGLRVTYSPSLRFVDKVGAYPSGVGCLLTLP
jgi:hypothetical protein